MRVTAAPGCRACGRRRYIPTLRGCVRLRDCWHSTAPSANALVILPMPARELQARSTCGFRAQDLTVRALRFAARRAPRQRVEPQARDRPRRRGRAARRAGSGSAPPRRSWPRCRCTACSGGTLTCTPSGSIAARQRLAQRRVRRHAARRGRTPSRRVSSHRAHRLGDLHVDDRRLERRGEVGHVDLAARLPLVPDVVDHRGLEAREREVVVAAASSSRAGSRSRPGRPPRRAARGPGPPG